ncbi:hypothetical protein F9Z58_25045, partial [Escherichia coli]
MGSTQRKIVCHKIFAFFLPDATLLLTCHQRRIGGARRIRKKSYAKVFRASVRAETSRLPVC